MSWPTKQLGELFDLENGFAFKSADFQASGVPVVKIKNVKAGYFSEHDFDYVSPDFRRSHPSKLARANDLLISMSGNRHDGSPETWVGKVAHFNKSGDYFLNQRVGALRLKSGLDANTRFFGYLMCSMPYQELFISIATSSGGQANLSPKQICAAEVLVPSKEEQDAIARVLGALDDKIELNRRMNETLEEMARALFRDWFVDFGPTRRQMQGATDPAAIMGHAFRPEKAATLAPLFPAKLGDVGLPEGWTNCSIYDFAKVVYGAPFKSKQFNTEGRGRPLARIRDLPKNVAGQFTEEVHKKEHLIQPGDIVIGMDGEFRSYLWYGVPTLMNQRVCSFVPLERSNRAFVWLAIKPLLKFFEDTAIATTVIHLGKGDIDTFSVVNPGEDVMTRFAQAAGPMASKIVANGQENHTLANLRDLLFPKLISGEIRLKEAEAVAE